MSILAEGGTYAHLAALQTPVNLLHRPFVAISGIIAESSTILKSGYNPIKLVFRTADGGSGGKAGRHTVLMKSSNDLRRDQMILGCIGLMDHLLQREGVDLKITTYKASFISWMDYACCFCNNWECFQIFLFVWVCLCVCVLFVSACVCVCVFVRVFLVCVCV